MPETTADQHPAQPPERRRSSADDAVIQALAAATGRQPRTVGTPTGPAARQSLADLRDRHAEAALRHLRNRYPTVKLSAVAFIRATTQAVHWADTLVAQLRPNNGRDPDPTAHAALVAALARRVAIDGPDVALESVSSCRQMIAADLTTHERPPYLPAPRTDPDVPSSEELGRAVRRVWVDWAREQENPKPSWLVPWDELDEKQREVDMRIGEAIFALAQPGQSLDRVRSE